MSETWPIGYRDTMRDGTVIEVAEELEKGTCKGCYFNYKTNNCPAPIYLCECITLMRDDHIGIIFKKIETQDANAIKTH